MPPPRSLGSISSTGAGLMFKNIFHLDEFDTVEHNMVAEAANQLEVGEFQVFQLGYESWFGNTPDPKLLEQVFFAYLLEQKIPHWTRHYARKIINLSEKGELEPYDPVYHRFDHDFHKRMPTRKGVLLFLATTVIFVFFFLAFYISLERYLPDDTGCLYPPCFWGEEMRAPPLP